MQKNKIGIDLLEYKDYLNRYKSQFKGQPTVKPISFFEMFGYNVILN